MNPTVKIKSAPFLPTKKSNYTGIRFDFMDAYCLDSLLILSSETVCFFKVIFFIFQNSTCIFKSIPP